MHYDFDMVVIGAGAAGLTAAGMSATLGAKTALIEAGKLGGDCTWTGCVPSKTLLKAAKVAHSMRTAERFGMRPVQPQFDFAKVMEHVHDTQNHIYEEADAPPIYERLGVKVLCARAYFLDQHRVKLRSQSGAEWEVSSRTFVIATGSGPGLPPVEGLSAVNYLTNETLFSLSKLPRRFIVVGSGPIGVEMAQAFRRFGSEVTVVSFENTVLFRDDRELSALLRESLAAEGIQFLFDSIVTRIERSGKGIRITADNRFSKFKTTMEGDAVLFATGRRANFKGLNLEAAGVRTDKAGVVIDKRCRTSRKNIFACGDVAGRLQFTHMAEHMAKVAVSNALLHFPASIDFKHAIWCTYSDPELAHVGASEEELKRKGTAYDIYRFPFSKIDRAVTENEPTGMIKVMAKSLTGKILGVSILGANAGEMIGEYALAMRNGITLRQFADTIHPYPTYVLGNRRAADQWYIRKLSPAYIRWLQRIFGTRGRLPDPPDPDRIM